MKKILLCLCLLAGYGMAQDKNNTKFVIPLQLEKITEQDTQVSPELLEELEKSKRGVKDFTSSIFKDELDAKNEADKKNIDVRVEQAKLDYAQSLDMELLQKSRQLDAISLEKLKLSNSYKKQRYNAQIELVGEKQKILREIANNAEHLKSYTAIDITNDYLHVHNDRMRNMFLNSNK